jgi:flagellar M-ring protein FliF
MLVRYGAGLLAVLLVLLLAVRPLIGKLRGRGDAPAAAATGALAAPLAGDFADDDADSARVTVLPGASGGAPIGDLPRQVELARRLAANQPERAVEALQRMLAAPDDTPAEPSAS